MKRALKPALILAAFVVALPIATVVAFFAGGGIFGSCADEILRTEVSPDGEYVMTVFRRDCGATTALSTHVGLSEHGDPETHSVFTAETTREFDASWDGPRSVLIDAGKLGTNRIFTTEEKWNEVVIRYSGM